MGESCWGTTDDICRLHRFTQLGQFSMLGRSDIWCRVSNSAPTIPPKLRGRTEQEFTTALTKKVARVDVRFFIPAVYSCEVHMFSDGTDLVTAVFMSSPISRVKTCCSIFGVVPFSSGLASPFPI